MKGQILESTRGMRILIFKNYKFCFDKVLSNGELYWRCSAKNLKCKAKAYTSGDGSEVVRYIDEHNHEEIDMAKLNRHILSSLCKKRAVEEISESTSNIINDELLSNMPETLTKADLDCVRQTMARARKKESLTAMSFELMNEVQTTMAMEGSSDQSADTKHIKRTSNNSKKKEKASKVPKSKSKKKQVCCVCLVESSDMGFAVLTDKDIKEIDYLTKLKTTVGDIEWQPSFSICLACTELLETVFTFHNTCRKSDEIRKQQLLDEKPVKKRKTRVKIKTKVEKIIDDSDDDQPLSDFLHLKTEDEKTTSSLKKENVEVKTEVILENEVEEPKDFKPIDAVHMALLVDPAKDVTSDLSDGNDNNEPEDSDEEFTEETAKKEQPKKRRRTRKGLIKQKNILKKTYNKRLKYIFQCDTCDLTCDSSRLLIEHCVTEHGMNPLEVRPYRCDSCPLKFKNATGILNHKRYHEERSNMCSYCGKGFIRKYDLLRHEKYHFNKREYSCDLCGKCFNTYKDVGTHKLVVHTDASQWKHVCEVCGKRFPQKSNLETHAKRHTGLRDVECHLCHKKFLEKCVLKKHLISHSNIKEHLCTICNKEYKHKRVLRVHMAKHHGIGIGEFKMPSQERKHKCHICPKAFLDKNKLRRHLYTHTGLKPYACPICDKRFNDNSYVKQHLRKNHGMAVGEHDNYLIQDHMKWDDEQGLSQALPQVGVVKDDISSHLC